MLPTNYPLHATAADHSSHAREIYVVADAYVETLLAADMSIAEVRTRFGDQLKIHPQSCALLDGREVSEDVHIRPGQTLTFIRPAGQIGG
jgi:hypothetical protein